MKLKRSILFYENIKQNRLFSYGNLFAQKEHSPTLVFVIAVYYLKKDHQWHDFVMHKVVIVWFNLHGLVLLSSYLGLAFFQPCTQIRVQNYFIHIFESFDSSSLLKVQRRTTMPYGSVSAECFY